MKTERNYDPYDEAYLSEIADEYRLTLVLEFDPDQGDLRYKATLKNCTCLNGPAAACGNSETESVRRLCERLEGRRLRLPNGEIVDLPVVILPDFE